MFTSRADIFNQLQSDILRLEGFKTTTAAGIDVGLGPIIHAFPNAAFPLGAMHEFLPAKIEDTSATNGFISGLLATLMNGNGAAMWISPSRKVFPPALAAFGIQPDRLFFVDVNNARDVMWVMDEALKCSALTAVIGELHEMSFTESRRLQLAVEQSGVTGFILRNPRKLKTSACVSRWSITSLPSEPIDGLPGIGFPKWRVGLLRVRNGRSGTWDIVFKNGRFETSFQSPTSNIQFQRRAV